jgi:hypothetical protein
MMAHIHAKLFAGKRKKYAAKQSVTSHQLRKSAIEQTIAAIVSPAALVVR